MLALELNRRTSKIFTEETPANPENAALFPDEVLSEVIAGQPAPSTPESRRVAMAELSVRAFLSRSKYEEAGELERLCEWFGRDALEDFFCHCEKCCLCLRPQALADRAFDSLSDLKCRLSEEDASAVRRAFRPWLEADGVIPVFNNSGAYLLPFSFIKKEGAALRAVDRSGAVLPEWTKHLQAIMDVHIGMDIQVSVHANRYVNDAGDSMMLPVAMAWLRKQERLPRYNPLRFIATGSLQGGVLGEVSAEEKAAKINRDVQDGVLVRPGSGREEFTVPSGLRMDRAAEFLMTMAESHYDGSPSYACRRLETLDRTVRSAHVGEWEPLIQRLDRLWGALDPCVDVEDHLHGLMLRSAARCHAGDTAKAEALNAEARKITCSRPEFLSQQLRLEIEELVLLQDEEDFKKIFSLAPDLGRRIDDFAAAENNSDRAIDLQMRYHGTMGQFEAYAALSGFNGMTPDSSKRRFDMAFGKAVELARRSRGRMGGDEDAYLATYNLGQDANYLLLWEALFGSLDGLVKASDKAKEYVRRSRDSGCVDYADKNETFRLRYEALGLYLSVLKGSTPQELPDEDDIKRIASSKGNWLPATTGKYLGAVAAARGGAVAARQLFEAAIEKLDSSSCPLFKCFRMTILAEAYRSLRKFPSEALYAESMRTKALDAFASDPDSPSWKKGAWKDWLEAKGTDADFPGLRYCY